MRLFLLIAIAVAVMSFGMVPAQVRAATPTPTASAPPEDPAVTQVARAELDAWQSGKVDRSKYSADAQKHITNDLVANIAKQMGPLGAPTSFKYVGHAQQYGMDLTQYEAVFPQITLTESISIDPTGKIVFIYFTPKQ